MFDHALTLFPLSALLLCSACGPLPTPSAPPTTISGTFFQPWLVEGWQQADWQNELSDLKAAGVTDHIIWQWTVDSFNKTAYYPTKISGLKQVEGMALTDPVETSLIQAQKAGLKVWLGLNWTDDWWKKYANDETWLANEFRISKLVAAELWQLYGGKYGGTIAGFYLTMEVDQYNFAAKDKQDRIKAVYKDVADSIHQNMNKPVMIAPFNSDGGGLKPAEWQTMWENILATAPIDVINMQDGCGASDDGQTTHTTTATAGEWFKVTRAAINKVRPATQLWSDLETFDMDAQGNTFPAKDFSRLQKQIDAAKPYVERISSFAVMHFQTRVGADDAYKATAAQQYALLKQQQGGR